MRTLNLKFNSITVYIFVYVYIYVCICIIRYCFFYPCIVAPVIDEPSPSTIIADVGATITLSCVSQGSPPDTFMWQREDDPMMLQSTSIGALEHTSTSAVFQANYTIDSVDFDNNGEYKCYVVNPIGSDYVSIVVIAISMCICLYD